MSEPVIKKTWRHGSVMTHAGSDILPNGKDVMVTIEKLEWREDESVNGRKKACWIGTFRPNPYTKLPFICIPTNMKMLRKLTGLEHPEDLKDFNVTLTREQTTDVELGGKTWGLRISKIKAPQNGIIKYDTKPLLTTESSNWDAMKEWLVKDGNEIAGILVKYDIDPEAMVELKKIKNDKF